MGGSGIAGELVRGLVDAEATVPLSVVRSPELPAALTTRAHVVVVSYSGETVEALRAYDTAGRAGALRVAMTSGGALAERAARDRVPLLPLPAGLPPRAAVGT
ncbi:bifunctional phosphoglucose/phosphomannose isomerase, partial [mine drainage metagenome]